MPSFVAVSKFRRDALVARRAPIAARRHSLLRRCLVASALAGGLLLAGCASGPPPTETELGEQALVAGDWRGALTHFALALRADPADGRARLGEARAHLSGRDPEAALRSFGALARIDRTRFQGEGREPYADALAAAVRVRLRRDQSEAAVAAARALTRLEPDRVGVRRLLAEALLAEAERQRLRGDAQKAYALYAETTRTDPSQLAGWVGSAELLIESKDGKGAVRLLEAARRYHPTAGEIRTLTIQALRFR